MKKFLCASLLLVFASPVFAINEPDAYQLKIEKEKKKQELRCLKNPQKCNDNSAQTQQLTLGVVQRDVKVGSTQEEVTLALGSPNIVTKDADGKNTWIYDKISTISSYNNSGFGVNIILAGYNKSKQNAQTTQKTLTVVIKFDKSDKVETFNYHMSKF